MDLTNLKNEFIERLSGITNLKELDILQTEFFGREKGKITLVLKNLKNLSEEERKKIGQEANNLKMELQNLFEVKKQGFLNKENEEKLKKEWIDITAPGKKVLKGSLHPITKTINEIYSIFHKMGFEIADGPEIETEFNNFDALNILKDHPARDMWDTFWLKSNQKEKLLLRTHTSPVQIRYMMSHNPPVRIIAPGRTFRYEAIDATHSHTFYQLEGLMVDNEISVANFKAVILEFFKKFFKKEITIRLRPSYFPFVEPGFEIDISCLACGGAGCSVCKHSGFLEIAGAGMVHPNVFKAVNYNPKEVQGFAFGFGIERLVMMKYKIPDIRLFYSGDLRFLKQF